METEPAIFTVRVTDPEEAEAIRKAADAAKQSYSSFLLLAGLERAAALANKG